jgi:hypothetical protein
VLVTTSLSTSTAGECLEKRRYAEAAVASELL